MFSSSRAAPLRSVLLPLFFLAIASLYLLTTNQNFSFDAITNAIACEANEPIRWFHPNHLLFPFIGVLYFKLERLLGYNGYAIYSLARLNAFFMAGALTLIAVFLARRISIVGALLGGAMLGVSYACWHYGVDGRAIGASVFFGALVIWKAAGLTKSGGARLRDGVVLAVLSSLYVFVHGIAIFHVLAVAWLLWKLNAQSPLRAEVLTVYFALFLAMVGIAYVSAYALLPVNDHFIPWVLGYAGRRTAAQAFESQFWVDSARELLAGLWTGWRRAFLFDFNDPLARGISHAVGIFGAVAIAVTFWKNLKTRDPLTTALLVWGALATMFLAFWSPGQEGFRLHVIIPWGAAAFAMWLKDRRGRWTVFILTAVLFHFNFSGPILAQADIRRNTGFQLLTEIRSRLHSGDVFLAAQSGEIPNIEVLRPYFYPEINGGTLTGRLYAFKETNLEPLKRRLTLHERRGEGLFFSARLWDPDVQREIELDRNLTAGSISVFLDTFSQVHSFQLSNGATIYRVTNK